MSRHKIRFLLIANLILPVALLLVSAKTSPAQELDISIAGPASFKIKGTAQTPRISGGELDGSVLEGTKGSEPPSILLKSRTGDNLAKADGTPNSRIQLTDEKGVRQFEFIKNAEGYLLNNSSNELVNRVKLKPDKFNLYNSKAERLLHGKQKPDGFGIKDETGTQTLKIKGTKDLLETSFFALQIPPKYQLLLWRTHKTP